MLRSLSSASSGPRPKISCRTSVMSASRSNRLSGVLALAVEQTEDQAADLRLGVFALDARQALEVQAAEQLLVDLALQRLIMRVADIAAETASSEKEVAIYLDSCWRALAAAEQARTGRDCSRLRSPFRRRPATPRISRMTPDSSLWFSSVTGRPLLSACSARR